MWYLQKNLFIKEIYYILNMVPLSNFSFGGVTPGYFDCSEVSPSDIPDGLS